MGVQRQSTSRQFDASIKRCKLQGYGHISHSSGLTKTIFQDSVKGGSKQSGQRKRREDNIREWTCTPGVRQVPDGSEEEGKLEKTGWEVICGAQMTLVVKRVMMMMIDGLGKQIGDKWCALGSVIGQSLVSGKVFFGSLCPAVDMLI